MGGGDRGHRVLPQEAAAELGRGRRARQAEDQPFLVRVFHIKPAARYRSPRPVFTKTLESLGKEY